MALEAQDRSRCVRAVELARPGCVVQEFREQGQCSYTLLVSHSNKASGIENDSRRHENEGTTVCKDPASTIVQIRPTQHALDLHIAQAAKTLHPSLAPATRMLDLELPGGLCAYEMERMAGTPLARLLPKTTVHDPSSRSKHERLIASFAACVAHGWHSSSNSRSGDRSARADSPMEDKPGMLSHCTGKVGSSIISRLEKLSKELPDEQLRRIASTTLERVKTMDDYPATLNHGDLIPSNILVDEETWEITGVVDWAEAEYLPFGTCLYGLESLLGYITTAEPSTSSYCAAPTFTYYDNAPRLRDMFWDRLAAAIPNPEPRIEDVRSMRDMGVLLWYGYAWDDGKIDRVVNETGDAVEVACVRAFLGAA
jgi:hypothetical protein